MPTEATQENEFIFRRFGDSFPQFLMDFWQAVPTWLLVLAVLACVARFGYAYYERKSLGLVKPSANNRWLGRLATLIVSALILWVLIVFYQRDSEQVKGGGVPESALGTSNSVLWSTFVAAVFVLGALFVILMYRKDSRSVSWYWATKLAILRIAVYAILCFVFLLPAVRTNEKVSRSSRVIVLIDVSPSMTRVTDEVDVKGRKSKYRMDFLIEFLTDDNVKFIQNILKDNPIVLYPFGTRLDENPQGIARSDKAWGKDEWEAFARYDFRPFLLKGLSEEGKEAVRKSAEWTRTDAGSVDWAASWYARRKESELVIGMTEPDVQTLKDNVAKLDRRIDVARTIALGTNVPDSVTAALNRESANMVQGIVVFSDGRSNLGSDTGYRELRNRATAEKIPVFTVAVGENRETSRISITDVQADETLSPDEGGKIVVEADGVNLDGKSVDVELDLFYLGKDGKGKDLKTATADYTLSAATSPNKLPYRLTFVPGKPPHGHVDFVIDPVKLAATPAGLKLTEESKDAAIKKRVLKEGEWAVRARIPKHENEAFPEPQHIRDLTGIRVVQRLLRVLLMAGAPGREFQFLRTFLVREVEEKRATVTLLVQNEAGGSGNLTPEKTERVIGRFPTRFDDKPTTPEERGYNLVEYDLIVAFDPDLSELSREQAEQIEKWVRAGGGLIYVADRINTPTTARYDAMSDNKRLSPLLDVLPVELDDAVLFKTRPQNKPRRLHLTPLPESDLLKLDDRTVDKKAIEEGEPLNDPIAGWERFFTDRDVYVRNPNPLLELQPHRGFYSCYPIKPVKKDRADVLAVMADLNVQGEEIKRPWLVMSKQTAGYRTCFMGSGETYRMLAYDKEYYERYWAKMLNYVGGKRGGVKAPRPQVLMSKDVISGSQIRIQARILDPAFTPYGPGKIEPKFKIRIGEKREEGPYVLRPTEFPGYYRGELKADPKLFPPGETDYVVVITGVDDLPEDKVKKSSFRVLPSDPEMDDTKVDEAAMLQMASDFDEAFQARFKTDSARTEFAGFLPKENGVPKLAFKLSGDKDGLKLIPTCFAPKEAHSDSHGPVNDLWSKGIEFPEARSDGTFLERNVGPLAGKKIPISWVMMLVIGLLCWEWTTRKLLRLA